MYIFTTLETTIHLPIILPFSSVTEIPTGTGISQSFPLDPFSALTLQKNKAKIKTGKTHYITWTVFKQI